MSAPARPAVLLAGASGLVGGALLRRLLADADGPRVAAVVRRPLELASPRLDVVETDFDRLARTDLPSAETAFCALGTTMAKAGTEERFRAVDLDAVVAFARAARRAGVTRFLAVSALGADSRSRVFYNRVKGEAEEALREVGFDGLALLRPSLLLGARSETRPAERVAAVVTGFVPWGLAGPLSRWRPVPADAVAAALLAIAGGELRGVRVVENDEIHRLASGSGPFVR
ncbi:MAG: NAD(P)H-binding protein [Thermoanaerobaculia bacterium]